MGTAEAVSKIADALKENDELPRKQIAEIVEVLGAEVALGLLAETRRVQDDGGLTVRDGTRRRTDGGVFFSLAKAKLPRADRNRIFRVRVPKAEGEGSDAPPPGEGVPVVSPPPAAPPPRIEKPRPSPNGSASAQAAPPGPPGLGRRRVVEVEVLRQHPKPPPRPEPVREVAPAPPPAAPRPPEPEPRPMRRIVVGAASRDEPPPATPDAAKERIRPLLRALGDADKRRALTDLLSELGVREPPPPKAAPVPAPARPAADDAALRERVLASVTDALGLSSSDLARALYGEETPGGRSKARVALERWRKSQG